MAKILAALARLQNLALWYYILVSNCNNDSKPEQKPDKVDKLFHEIHQA